MEKIIPEYSTHNYKIPLRKFKTAFGVKGSYIDDIRSRGEPYTDDDGKAHNDSYIYITTRQYKKELEEEEKTIPDDRPDSARG